MAGRRTLRDVPRQASSTLTVADHLGLAARAHALIGVDTGGTTGEPVTRPGSPNVSQAGTGEPVKQTHTRKRTK